jgi:hypothetical protein
MSLFNHIGSVKPGDIVKVSGQSLQNGDVSYWPDCDMMENIGKPLTGLYLSLRCPDTGSCEILIAGKIHNFWHPEVSVILLVRETQV